MFLRRPEVNLCGPRVVAAVGGQLNVLGVDSYVSACGQLNVRLRVVTVG